MAPLVRIPRELLHVRFEDLAGLGVREDAQGALRALLADLPLVPDATLSAWLIGPREVTLPCLAVLARHVGQGLRDHNLGLAHDRARLHAERRKLAFMDAAAVAAGQADEAVLFAVEYTPRVIDILRARDSAGLATFVTTDTAPSDLPHWRRLNLGT